MHLALVKFKIHNGHQPSDLFLLRRSRAELASKYFVYSHRQHIYALAASCTRRKVKREVLDCNAPASAQNVGQHTDTHTQPTADTQNMIKSWFKAINFFVISLPSLSLSLSVGTCLRAHAIKNTAQWPGRLHRPAVHSSRWGERSCWASLASCISSWARRDNSGRIPKPNFSFLFVVSNRAATTTFFLGVPNVAF